MLRRFIKILKVTTCQTTKQELYLAVYSVQRFWHKAAVAKQSTSLNDLHACIYIGSFTNMLIKIHANFLKNQFLPKIIENEQNVFTVRFILKIKTTYIVGLLSKQSTTGVAIVYKQNVNTTAFT